MIDSIVREVAHLRLCGAGSVHRRRGRAKFAALLDRGHGHRLFCKITRCGHM
jgi:hypothetical protein